MTRPPIAWRLATVADVVVETPRAKTLVLDAPGWPAHLAGQHVDVRLTAEDGYQAERSYSIASPPEGPTRHRAAHSSTTDTRLIGIPVYVVTRTTNPSGRMAARCRDST